jgi:transcriptional antiterminator NusG
MRNLFPGYLFVEVEMTDELWYVIRNTPGVTGFIGSSGKGAKPIPVRDADMLNVLALAGEKSEAMPEVKYNVGDIVKILTGPFVNNEGKITSINGDKVNVEIIFFGRSTDVEIEVTNIAAVK